MKASEILNLENRQSVEFEARGARFKVHRNDTSLVGPDMEEKYILSVHVRGERQFIDALSRTRVEEWVAQLIEQGVLEP